MRVWVTRAEPGAEATAARLRALGCEPFVHPLLKVRTLEANPDLDGVTALAFTSANGVRAFAERERRRDLPVFAVGRTTADAARLAGFAEVASADGDVTDLAALIRSHKPALLLHAGAREPAGDLAGALQTEGLAVRSLALYETVATPPPSPLPALDAALIHSPRAGGLLAHIAEARPLIVACISVAAAAPLAAAGFERLATAEFPNEAALLKLLGLEGR